MFKNTLLILIFSMFFSSCAIKSINYTYDFKTIAQGIDFTQSQEQWLLNTNSLPIRFQELILKKFNKWTRNKTKLTSNMVDKQGAKVSGFFSTSFAKGNFTLLKQTTNYKFFTNVYLLKSDKSTEQVQVAEMAFDVYDLTTNKMIFSQIVTAAMGKKNTSNIGDIHGFRIAVTPDIINGLVKKGLKRIDKNSKY